MNRRGSQPIPSLMLPRVLGHGEVPTLPRFPPLRQRILRGGSILCLGVQGAVGSSCIWALWWDYLRPRSLPLFVGLGAAAGSGTTRAAGGDRLAAGAGCSVLEDAGPVGGNTGAGVVGVGVKRDLQTGAVSASTRHTVGVLPLPG